MHTKVVSPPTPPAPFVTIRSNNGKKKKTVKHTKIIARPEPRQLQKIEESCKKQNYNYYSPLLPLLPLKYHQTSDLSARCQAPSVSVKQQPKKLIPQTPSYPPALDSMETTCSGQKTLMRPGKTPLPSENLLKVQSSATQNLQPSPKECIIYEEMQLTDTSMPTSKNLNLQTPQLSTGSANKTTPRSYSATTTIGERHAISSPKAPTSMSKKTGAFLPSSLSTPLPVQQPSRTIMKTSLNDTQEKVPTPSPTQEMPNIFSPLGKIQLSKYLTPSTFLSPNASGDTGRSTPTIENNPESGAASFLTPLSNSGESGRKTKSPQTQWSTETTPAQVPNLSNNSISETTQDTLATPFENSMGDEDCPTSPVTSLRANDSSVIKPNFRVYSHNVNGLRDEQKLEYLPNERPKNRCIPHPGNAP